MRVLALDTTTREGSVALVEDDRIIAEQSGDGTRSHAERLPGDLMRLLAAHQQDSAAIDLFAVVAGPGSFTGLRIGIATMQGLAFVHHRRIVAVSALEALAHTASRRLDAGSLVAAWIDAHRHEVFSALYEVAEAPLFTAGRLLEVEPPAVGPPSTFLAGWGNRQVAAFIGDGASAYAPLIAGKGSLLQTPLLAGAAGLMAARERHSAVDPARVQPIYVRRPDAEMARERDRARS